LEAAALSQVRIDLWLWAARFFKTRALAKQAISGGRIELNGQSVKPAKLVRVDDQLRINVGETRFEVTVLALSDKRGPAPVARTLYAESEQSIAAREASAQARRLIGRVAPPTRPEGRDRRALRALKGERD